MDGDGMDADSMDGNGVHGEVRRSTTLPCTLEAAWGEVVGEKALSDWLGGAVRLEPTPGGTIEFDDPRGVTRWGVIEEYAEPSVLQFSWHDRDGDRSATTVRFEFESVAEGTRLVISESFPHGWPYLSAVSTTVHTTGPSITPRPDTSAMAS